MQSHACHDKASLDDSQPGTPWVVIPLFYKKIIVNVMSEFHFKSASRKYIGFEGEWFFVVGDCNISSAQRAK
jgi:hypothetical protein